jgi:hypothetical protein
MACIPDTVTPKGVIINLNSGSDYTNCTVYTGLTDSVITGTTNCVNVTGTTCSLTGLSATLLEIYVRIDCEGCCSNTFRVNLDECCDYVESTPTPTTTPTLTPTLTATPDQPCYCYSYEVTSSEATINFINCDDVSINISGVTSGATYQICSIVDPVAIEGTAIITLTGICVDGNCPEPEPTLTATPEPTLTATPEPTLTATPEPTPTATPICDITYNIIN